jgi:hypothetical protein
MSISVFAAVVGCELSTENGGILQRSDAGAVLAVLIYGGYERGQEVVSISYA